MHVWIDGKRVARSAESGTIELAAGEKYDIKVAYVQKTGPAKAQLMWATKGMTREVIPDEDLLPAPGSVIGGAAKFSVFSVQFSVQMQIARTEN